MELLVRLNVLFTLKNYSDLKGLGQKRTANNWLVKNWLEQDKK